MSEGKYGVPSGFGYALMVQNADGWKIVSATFDGINPCPELEAAALKTLNEQGIDPSSDLKFVTYLGITTPGDYSPWFAYLDGCAVKRAGQTSSLKDLLSDMQKYVPPMTSAILLELIRQWKAGVDQTPKPETITLVRCDFCGHAH